jgi:hypothetical protein
MTSTLIIWVVFAVLFGISLASSWPMGYEDEEDPNLLDDDIPAYFKGELSLISMPLNHDPIYNRGRTYPFWLGVY